MPSPGRRGPRVVAASNRGEVTRLLAAEAQRRPAVLAGPRGLLRPALVDAAVSGVSDARALWVILPAAAERYALAAAMYRWRALCGTSFLLAEDGVHYCQPVRMGQDRSRRAAPYVARHRGCVCTPHAPDGALLRQTLALLLVEAGVHDRLSVRMYQNRSRRPARLHCATPWVRPHAATRLLGPVADGPPRSRPRCCLLRDRGV